MTDRSASKQGPITENENKQEVSEALTSTVGQSDTIIGNKRLASSKIADDTSSQPADSIEQGEKLKTMLYC